jgi:CHAT domain-containing protein
MQHKAEDESLIRRYLLFELTEEEQQQIERRLMVDAIFFDKVAAAEDELIAEYLEGRLVKGEKERFEQFLSTPEGRQQLNFTRDLRDYLLYSEPQALKPSGIRAKPYFQLSSKPLLSIAALLIITCSVGLGVWWIFSRESQVDKALIALKSNQSEKRSIEARAAGFKYAPIIEFKGVQQESADNADQEIAKLSLLNEVKQNPSAVSYHALGLVYLFEKNFNEAIRQFELALQSERSSAQLYNDLGAAYLEKGKSIAEKSESKNSEPSGESYKSYSNALDNFTRAIELNRSLPEPLFNRALTQQYIGLYQRAKQDWQEYLKRDSDSQWADEARHKLRLIEESEQKERQNKSQLFQEFTDYYKARDDEKSWQIIRQTRDTNGSLIVNKLLNSYLAASSGGQRQEAEDRFQALRYAANLEFQKTGDRYTSDLLEFYRQATGAQRTVSALSRKRLKKSFRRFTRTNNDEAVALCVDAKEQFESVGNSCEASFASFRMAHCLMIQLKLEKALPILERLYQECSRRGYTWLLAQCVNQLAAIKIGLKEYTSAISYSHESLNLFEKVDDINGEFRNLVQLAEEYRLLNDPDKSLGFLQRGSLLMDSYLPGLTYRWSHYTILGFNFNSLCSYKTALEFRKEALRIASILNTPLLVARSYEYLALTCGKLKQYDDAIANVREVSKIADGLPSEDDRLGLIAHSNLVLGQILNEGEQFDRAIEAFNESLEAFNKIKFQQNLYAAHKGKLLAYIAQKNEQSIDEEIRKVFSLFEEYRAKIPSENHRNSFFDAEQQIYDIAIDFKYSRQMNHQQAFDFSELCRARSFLDSMQAGADVIGNQQGPDLTLPSVSTSLTLSDLQQMLPDEVQIIQYAVLEDKTIVWVVTQKGIVWSTEFSAGLNMLEEKAREFQELISSPSDESQNLALQQARDLYEILIEPVESHLDKNKLLVIVPDKSLHRIPFHALLSPAGKYLVEDYSLQYSLSSSMFVECSKVAASKQGVRSERMLSVGSPDFDRNTFKVSPLQSSVREAEKVAKYYTTSYVFTGPKPTEGRVRAEMEKSNVINFATHLIANESSPLRSKLLLANEQGQTAGSEDADGMLQSYEIYKLRLNQTRLVVLSACQTGIEQVYKGEGPISMARSFLSANVPLVVASLWPIDSESSGEFMIGFHKHRTRDRMLSVEAIRQTQLAMIGGQDSRYRKPFYWAAFMLIGGYAQF